MPRSDVCHLLLMLMLLVCRQADAANEATMKRLHEDLTNNYDRHIRPVQDSSTITHVTFHMDIHEVDLMDHDLLEVDTLTYWEWNDGLLKWDPNRYEGIKEVAMKASSIWTPEIVHVTGGQLGNSLRSVMPQGGSCRVTSDGDVSCVKDAAYLSHCGVDLAKWPYDQHSCFLSFVNWLDLNNEVSVTLRNGTGFSLKNLKLSLNWQLVSLTSQQIPRQNDERNGYRKLVFNFYFKRHSEAYAATVVAPALVLSVATLATLLVPAWLPERFSVSLCLMVAQLMCLVNLYHDFSYRVTVPLIVLLYRDSLIMTSVALVLAVMMRALIQSNMQAPDFVVSLLDQVPTWRWGLSLLAQPREKCHDRRESLGVAVWRQMASLLDRCCLCCYCVLLLVLLASLVP